ncbi:MAG: hypothetical protein GY771_13310 [bacterium]|nr:hypothetical protein [bacterium]
MTLKKGASPQEVAAYLYKAIENDDFGAFKEAILKRYREQFEKNVRGISPEFWWDSGRRYVTDYGVSWHFDRIDSEDEKHAKLFFQRKHPDGSNRGRPVPVHVVIDEDGEWRVQTATP